MAGIVVQIPGFPIGFESQEGSLYVRVVFKVVRVRGTLAGKVIKIMPVRGFGCADADWFGSLEFVLVQRGWQMGRSAELGKSARPVRHRDDRR